MLPPGSLSRRGTAIQANPEPPCTVLTRPV